MGCVANVLQSELPKNGRAVKKLFASKARINYLVPKTGKYFIVIEFCGTDMTVNLTALTCNDCMNFESIDMPLRIIGDKSIAPIKIYPVVLVEGTRFNATALGSGDDVNLYDVSLYGPTDGKFNPDRESRLARASAEGVPSKKKNVSTSKGETSYVVPETGRYFVVLEFYGSGVMVEFSAALVEAN